MGGRERGYIKGKVRVGEWVILLVRPIILVEEMDIFFEKILCLRKIQLIRHVINIQVRGTIANYAMHV